MCIHWYFPEVSRQTLIENSDKCPLLDTLTDLILKKMQNTKIQIYTFSLTFA